MKVLKNVPLSDFSNFGVGGPADEVVFVEHPEELVEVLEGDFLLFGEATNVLFPDEGLKKRVIFNRQGSFEVDGLWIVADSGANLAEIVRTSVKKHLSGLEYLAGIPGTLGGAIFGNAGAFGRQIGDIVKEVEYWKEGKIIRTKRIGFGYRDSQFKREGGIILRAWLKLERGTGRETKIMEEVISLRKKKHPPKGTACAGSFFKNVILPNGEKIAAGLLLDRAGAKGLSVGDARVFEGHANFIINAGNATAKDILALAEKMKKRVKQVFGITLEEEVIIVRDP